jgi:hypothetical protein
MDWQTIIISIFSSGALAAIIGVIASQVTINKEYKSHYKKMVLEKRISIYSDLSSQIGYFTTAYFLGTPKQSFSYFYEESKFEAFDCLCKSLIDNRLFLSYNLLTTLLKYNRLLMHSTNLRVMKTLPEIGVLLYSECLKLSNELQDNFADDMKNLYKNKRFFSKEDNTLIMERFEKHLVETYK